MKKTEDTSTLILFNQNPLKQKSFDLRVALRWHAKFEKWLPPGGHRENELPHQCALRECKEELAISEVTLFELRPTPLHAFYLKRCQSIITPFLCQIGEIPPTKKQEAHRHLDFIYLGYITHFLPQQIETEPCSWQWMDQEQVRSLDDGSIFPETKASLLYLFEACSSF